jgi:hypothetical protein
MAGGFVDPETGLLFSEDQGAAGPEPQGEFAQGNEAPLLPQGFTPISHTQAAALLHERHRITVEDDDPLLMMVTLQSRFLEDLSTMLGGHDKAIEAAIKSTASSTVGAVNEALETLKDKTVLAGLNHAMALVKEQAVAMDRFERVTRRHLWIIMALTASSWIGLGLSIALLWGLLR